VRQQRTQERRHDREHVGMLRQAHHPPPASSIPRRV
jgi:hypothetical protein